jgi:hypothetical protein
MEDIAEDDNIVHILASLESDRSFPLNQDESIHRDNFPEGYVSTARLCFFVLPNSFFARYHAINPSHGMGNVQHPTGEEESGEEDSGDIEEWGDSDFSERHSKESKKRRSWGGNSPAMGEDTREAELEESDSYGRRPKDSKRRRSWSSVAPTPSFTSTVRSFACEKHSKWKKKCPPNCPLRKEHARVPMARRKLWTKKESALLVRWADDLVQAARETDDMWEDIAKTLNRSVNSTKKKFMRYAESAGYFQTSLNLPVVL